MFDGNCIMTFMDLELADAAYSLFVLTFLMNAKSREWFACVSFLSAAGVYKTLYAHV